MSKKSYIVVVHNWHVYSDGFVVHHFQAENDEEAKAQEALYYKKHDRDFSKAATTLIPLEDGKIPRQYKVPTRKLTWKERLLGRVKMVEVIDGP